MICRTSRAVIATAMISFIQESSTCADCIKPVDRELKYPLPAVTNRAISNNTEGPHFSIWAGASVSFRPIAVAPLSYL